MNYGQFSDPLGGSWVVISRLTIVIAYTRGLI